ncbi:MAG: T9SS type A sorting domain-containing protein [Bacteroidota bacterium]
MIRTSYISQLRSALQTLWKRPATQAVAIVFCFSVLALAAAFQLTVVSSDADDELVFPIEVMGPDGYTRSVSLQVADAEAAAHVYMRAHSIGYPYHHTDTRGYDSDKASVRLNGGAWLNINNDTVECEEPEASVRCIDGPMHTVRFRIPLNDLGDVQEGQNVVQFRMNYPAGDNGFGDPSMGYRILALEVQSAGDANLSAGTPTTWDDPGTWTAPEGFDSTSDIEAGRTLWNERDLLVEGWDGPTIRASCNDCHVDGGYDLQYFAYSNYAIEQRSEFHGLSEAQGKQIAAYIRSITIETSDGQTIAPPGRPWQPPYQPGGTSIASRSESDHRTSGESMDAMDQTYWAAGAGTEWVLERDSEMRDHVFPNGITPDAFSIDDPLNMRETPVSLQMPDWNEWLPEFHPLDVWDNEFENSDAWDYYVNEVPDRINEDRPWRVEESAERAAQELWRYLKNDWAPPSGAPAPYDYEIARQVPMKWGLVKTFEIFQPHHNEEHAQDLYSEEAEPRQWTSFSRVMFDMAPHIIGGKGSNNEIMDLYHDTAWYQHQITLNPGSALTTGLKPVDWKYHYQHLSAVNAPERHYWRYLVSYMKMVQVAHTVPNDHSDTEPRGWYMRHLTPAIADKAHFWGGPLRDMPDDEYRQALNVIMSAYADGLAATDMNDWARLEDDQHGLEPESHVPQYMHSYDRFTYADHFWTALQNFGEYGVAYEVLHDLATWANEAWPEGDWMGHIASYEDNPPIDDAPTASEQTVALDAGWNIISTRMIDTPRPMEEVLAPILDEVILVKDDRGRPFSPPYDLDVLDTWMPDEAYQIYVTSAVDLPVEGTARPASDPVELSHGWNFIPYLPTEPMDVEDAIASLGDDLIFMKDMTGAVYLPDPDDPINTIDVMGPGKGYMAYVTADATLEYPEASGASGASQLQALARSASSAEASGGYESAAVLVATGTNWDPDIRIWVETDQGERVGHGRIADGALVANVRGPSSVSNAPHAQRGDALTIYTQHPNSEPEAVDVHSVRNVLSDTNADGLVFEPQAVYRADVEAPASASGFAVEGHAPNPVRSQATLTFTLPENTHVRIEVYNTIGQRVATWLDRSMSSGTHELDIKAQGLASGTYFYRVQTDRHTESRRLTVVR